MANNNNDVEIPAGGSLRTSGVSIASLQRGNSFKLLKRESSSNAIERIQQQQPITQSSLSKFIVGNDASYLVHFLQLSFFEEELFKYLDFPEFARLKLTCKALNKQLGKNFEINYQL